MKLADKHIEILKNGINGKYDLPLHGSQTSVRQVSFNRWTNYGKDRLYFNIQLSGGRQTRAGYIDLETGDLVPEAKNETYFEDAMVILYALIADVEAEAQAEAEANDPDYEKTYHTYYEVTVEELDAKIAECGEYLKRGTNNRYSKHSPFGEIIAKRETEKRNHRHVLKILRSLAERNSKLRFAGSYASINMTSFDGILEAIRGETEYEYL